MRNFIEELDALPIPISSNYITKEVALDRELQRNPDLLSILSGENPLPDSVILDVSPNTIDGLDAILDRYNYLFVSKDEESYQAYVNQIESIR